MKKTIRAFGTCMILSMIFLSCSDDTNIGGKLGIHHFQYQNEITSKGEVIQRGDRIKISAQISDTWNVVHTTTLLLEPEEKDASGSFGFQKDYPPSGRIKETITIPKDAPLGVYRLILLVQEVKGVAPESQQLYNNIPSISKRVITFEITQ